MQCLATVQRLIKIKRRLKMFFKTLHACENSEVILILTLELKHNQRTVDRLPLQFYFFKCED